MAASCFRATYTLDGHKKLRKNWKWLDGFVSQSGRDAKLYDEDGSVVGVARLQPAEALAEGEEVARSFGANIVVAVDAPCALSDVRGGAGSAAAPAADAVAAPPAAASQPLAPAGKARPGGVVLRGSGGSRKPAFKAPRPLPAAAAPAAAPPTGVAQRSLPAAPFPPPTAAPPVAAAPAAMPAPRQRAFVPPARRVPVSELPPEVQHPHGSAAPEAGIRSGGCCLS